MFGNFRIADLIAFHFALIDQECRKELKNGVLVSERDYVTALTTKLRYLPKQLNINFHSQTIAPREENLYGVDGIIIFRIKNEIKIGLFEAKRPQVTKKNHSWDYLSSRKISHFSEQIEKQNIWIDDLAVWEMFFNESKSGYESPPFDYFGSSCVWHENARKFMHTEGLIFSEWNTNKLKKLLNSNGINFYSIIYDILSCRKGKIQLIDEKSKFCRVVSSKNDNTSLNIPIPLEPISDRDERIDGFLNENKLETYIYIELPNKLIE